MNWNDQLTLTYIKGLLGITTNAYDTVLQGWVDFLVEELLCCGICLDNTNLTVTDIISPQDKEKHIVSNNGSYKIVSIGPWSQIDTVEVSSDGVNWKVINEHSDYAINRLSHIKSPIIELKSRNNCDCSCDGYWKCKTLFRITGIKGYGDNETLPGWLTLLFTESVSAIFDGQSSGSAGGTFLKKEKTKTKEREYGLIPGSTCNVCKYEDVLAQGKFKSILKKYCPYKCYSL
jgi:hypothetical protein